MDTSKIGIAILNRNEEEGLRHILPQILGTNFRNIFCVDGFSMDKSIEILNSYGVYALSQQSGGRGEAMQIAIEYAVANRWEHLIFISSDGNENALDLVKFLNYLEYDLVIASRMLPESFNEEDIFWFRPRKWANHFFNFLINLKSPNEQRVTDCLNGFRMLKTDRWSELSLDAPGYGIEFQMTLRAITSKLKIVEFPTHEGQRIGGKSGVNPVRIVLQLLGLWLRE